MNFYSNSHSISSRLLSYKPSQIKNVNSIFLCDAPAGAGKTRGLCEIAVNLAKSGQAVLFVQPTNILIGETIREISQMGGSAICRRMDETNTTNVVKSITNYLKNADQEGQILLITHSAFERLRYIHRPDRWNLIIDEALQVHNAVNMRFKRTHAPLTSLLAAEPTDDTWSRLQIIDFVGLAKLKADMANDDALNLFAPAINLLESPHWQVLVRTEAYQTLCAGESKANVFPQLYSVMGSSICSGFKSVRIAGARIGESLLVNLWKSQGVRFQSETFNGLKFASHVNCERIKIYYGIKGHWSKYLRDKHRDCVWLPLIEKVKDLSSGNEFLYVANNDTKNIFPDGEKAIRLSNMPHGLNIYKHINMVAFFSALNLNNQYVAFLESQGLTSDDIHCDIYHHKAYQAIMRGGIRNHKKTDPQVVVVPDEGLAVWLQSIFIGAQIEWLGLALPEGEDGKPGRHKIYANNAEKQKAYRERSTRDHLDLLEHLISLIPNVDQNEEIQDNIFCHDPPYIYGYQVTRFRACIWDSYKNKFPSSYKISADHAQFIDTLKKWHDRKIEFKENNQLFSVGIPAPNDRSMRVLKNIVLANGILLDNDAGDLAPEVFSSLFPATEMVIFNTYSSKPGHLRWRVYIPTECVMTSAIYTNVIERIFISLEKAGYYGKKSEEVCKHGFDEGKKTAADLMYLPSQAADPKGSFFLEFREPSRKPLDPRDWINFDDQPECFKSLVRTSASGNDKWVHKTSVQVDIEADLDVWRCEGNRPHCRNSGWTKLYFALVRKGTTGSQIDETMTQEALMCSDSRVQKALIAQLKRLQNGGRR